MSHGKRHDKLSVATAGAKIARNWGQSSGGRKPEQREIPDVASRTSADVLQRAFYLASGLDMDRTFGKEAPTRGNRDSQGGHPIQY
jgi:hypothetical protein